MSRGREALRLDVQMSWWGMSGLREDGRGNEPEAWVSRIAEAGFTGINGFLPEPEEAPRWRRLLESHALSFSVNAYPRNESDLAEFLQRAASYDGPLQYVNAQVMAPFVTGGEAEKLLGGLMKLSEEARIPVFVETHRGTITQDLLRTVSYVETIDPLRLTVDFSHYVAAGEMHTLSEEAEALLQRLLPKTSSIHARVSNGEQIQVNVGEHGDHPMMPHFRRWWKDGMAHWRRACSGSFPFVCELGPPPYAITVPDGKGGRTEPCDRWQQSLLFAGIARELWAELEGEDEA